MSKRSSKGTTLKIEIASVYTSVAQLISLNGPGPEVQDTETPTLDQVGNEIAHDVTGWVEPGTSDFEIYWDPLLTTHQTLTSLLGAPAVKNWQNQYPVGTPMSYSAILKSLTPAAGVGEMLKASGSMQLTGLATYPEAPE
ncbi:MAG TPA: phage tail tube protein [Planctomicrobium sp.]|nr:phage tail tube protein [Planctomicrobium sp.]